MYAIEKNIAVPPPTPKFVPCDYPWEQMEIGDSFFVPDKQHKRVAASAYYARKKYGRAFITKAVEGGVRAWRIA